MTRAEHRLLLFRLADLIERDIELLATIEGFDVGRPVFEPRLVDLPNVVDVSRHFAGWADKIRGALDRAAAVLRTAAGQAYTIREPVGVIGAITAWNAPHADRLVEARARARGRRHDPA